MDFLSQDFQDAIDVIQRHSDDPHFETEFKYYETLGSQLPSVRAGVPCYPLTPVPDVPGPMYDCNEQAGWVHNVPEVPLTPSTSPGVLQVCSMFPPQRSGKGRKKLRLYEYLHEALHDANMADSIQWADRSSGTFHFVSKNKEKLAECWGTRKGNRKTMTYQKMARALRNYSRTGEIIKVRRKLTYQFNPMILQRLSHTPGQAPRETVFHQYIPAEQSFYNTTTATPDWHNWYGHFPCHGEYDLSCTLSHPSATKA
ncbi:transcription factor Spi-C-like [Megalops cyprinoides]|uniref:transcription factor Spi-C-like n=1 Tax=Megalops cyprinoides TaxID=118141 RepID=UPI001864E6CB|nr:transcription factor Spi-C-like [Megalops cyprinoides]